MRSATVEMLQVAHKAIIAGTSIGTVTGEEWFAEQFPEDAKDEDGNANKLNYSQTWRYHTRQFVTGGKCAHCTKALGGHTDIADLVAIAEDDAKVKLAVGKAIAEGQSWGLISVRLGNSGVANGLWPESRVRSTFRTQADRHDKGLRPAHRGGRFVQDRDDLYKDEVALGTKGDGYIRKADEKLPPRDGTVLTEEQKAKRNADLDARRKAHQRTLNNIKAQYAKLIKQG